MQEQDPILGKIAQGIAANPPKTEQGQQILGDLTSAEQQVRLQKSSNYYNLVTDLDPSKAMEIGKEVKKGFDSDDESRQPWLEMNEFWLRLYMQTDFALNSDQDRDWGATESVPLLTEACDQFQSRTYKAFFPNEQFVSAVVTRHSSDPKERKEQQKRAERIGRHISWQLGIQNQDFKRDKRALFLSTSQHGSFFTKTYFNVNKKRVCIDNVRPTDFVVNYTIGPKRICDVRRKSHIIYTTVGETEMLFQKDYLSEAAKPDNGESSTIYNEAADEAVGMVEGNHSIKRDLGATLIEQQFWLDIDDNNQFRPYLGTIDISNGRLLRLTVDYEADENGNPIKDYEQIQYYTHYKFMENPDGFYGLGLGAKIGDLNAAVNIGVRQMLDAATLSTAGNHSGFISNRFCMDGEEDVTLTMGKFKKVPDNVGDLSNGIMQMKFPGPNEAQGKLIEMLDARAQRMAGTTEATTGSIEKNMQPTTVLAQIEQGLELFSSVQMGLADDFGDELQKIYHLNQKHMPFVEYFSVNEVPEAVTRMDYADDMSVVPIFDPKFATQTQKMTRAQAVGQVVMQNPFLAQNPQIMNEVTRTQLEAMDVDDVDSFVPPPPPPPANIDNQEAENMMFLQPPNANPPFQVFPDQHHAQHLASLEQFVKDKGHLIPPEQQPAIVAHRQMHEGFLYGQQKGLIPNAQPQAISGPASRMGGAGRNNMGSQAAPAQISSLPGLTANPLNGAMSPSQPPSGNA